MISWCSRTQSLFLAFGFLAALVSCTPRSKDLSQHAVLKVNAQSLSLREFSNQLGRRLKELDALSAKSTETVTFIKEEILRSFITRALVLDYASSKNLVISANTLDAEVEKLRATYPDDVTFRRTLAEEGISFSEWRDQLRSRLIEKLVFEKIAENLKSPTPEEMRVYYQQNQETFKTKERVYLRQIVVEEQAKAELLKNDLKKQKMEDLAKKYSVAPEGKSGGLVGWIGRGEVDFFDPTFSYKIGVPGPIFQSPFGFHIVTVERKSSASTQSFEDARGRIERDLRAMKEQALFTEWLDSQLRSSRVWRDYNLINSVRVDTK
jgi:peptidyl-prolyl cis-trans isomerase C